MFSSYDLSFLRGQESLKTMHIKDLHSWNLSYSQARDCQYNLASKVRFTPLKKQPKLIAGIDCAFSRDGKKIIAAVVVLEFPGFSLIETSNSLRKVNFPYIPGLLSFREAPACIGAVEKLVSSSALALNLAGIPPPEEHEAPAPYLFKIIVRGDEVEFLGGQGDAPVRVTLAERIDA